jgi:hypothetical protein
MEIKMNSNLLNVLQQMINEYGEDILNNPKRVRGLLADIAAREPKAEKKALVKCFEMGFYTELKNTDETEPQKGTLVERLRNSEGFALELCEGSIDIIAALANLQYLKSKTLKTGDTLCPKPGMPMEEVSAAETPVASETETTAKEATGKLNLALALGEWNIRAEAYTSSLDGWAAERLRTLGWKEAEIAQVLSIRGMGAVKSPAPTTSTPAAGNETELRKQFRKMENTKNRLEKQIEQMKGAKNRAVFSLVVLVIIFALGIYFVYTH